ncbi:MAG: exo-alpha-sialidase [Bacteroidaceae bacterium]|nr:exo-alpha-sialidase [Bacteroidaceae bacterium]
MRNFYRILSLAVFAVATLSAWAAVPFKTTSIVGGKFAANTTWYTMQIGTNQHIISDNAGASKISLTKVMTDMSDADLWCFVGDDTNGYKIYNKQAGTGKVLASSSSMKAMAGYGGTGGSTYPTMQDASNLPSGYIGTWDIRSSDKLAGVDGYFVILHGTNYAMNNFGGIGDLAFWAEGMDAGSTVSFGFAEGQIEINAANGTFTASNANKTWHAVWESNQLAGFSLSTGQNNMTTDGGYIAAHSGTSYSCTHTLTAPQGMCIAGYSFDMKNRNGDNSYSENIVIGSKTYKSSASSQHVEVTGLEDRTASFQQTGANKGVIFSNYYVTLRRSTVVPEAQYEVFTTTSTSVPYRIPAIAKAKNGNLIAVADYRHSGADIGMATNGRIDIHGRISTDNGKTWGNIFPIIEGQGAAAAQNNSMYVAFGDPCLVADSESETVMMFTCSGNVSFPNGQRNNHQGIARFYSYDNGVTWGKPVDISESIYSQFDKRADGGIRCMFIGSGKISQSKTLKVGSHYRLYCAPLVKLANGSNVNFVLYSDDFGGTWKVLGGVENSPIPSGGDEPKADELPDGSVLVSSRTSGGRIYNIYRYTDAAKGEGSWGNAAWSNSSNNGTTAVSNSTNGEIMFVPVRRLEDDKKMYMMLQSVPLGSGRANVGIYYKALESLADFSSPENIAKDWDGRHQASYLGSAYSTMCWQADNTIAFLFEEETHCNTSRGGYTIVYKNYSIEDITDGAYTYDATSLASDVVINGIDARKVEAGSYVGGYLPEAVEAVNQAIEDYKANPSRAAYEAINKMLTTVPTIQVEPGHWYRLRNTERASATLYMTPEATRFTAKVADNADADQMFQFAATGTAGQYYLYNGNFGLYLGKLGANETQPSLHVAPTDAGVWSIVTSGDGKCQVNCVNKTGSNPGLHLAGDNTRLVPWASNAPASLWYIEPVTTYPVTVGESGYATLNLPFAVQVVDGVKAYVPAQATEVNGVAALLLEEVETGLVPANTPVVLTAEAGQYALEVVYPANSAALDVIEGWKGTLKFDNVSDNVFVQDGDKMVKNTGTSIWANSAYYVGDASVDSYALSFEGSIETSINGVETVKKNVKLYDLNGRRVVKPGKGIYVTEEGKKVLF